MVVTRQSLRESLQPPTGVDKTQNAESIKSKDSMGTDVSNKDTCSEETSVEMDLNLNINSSLKETHKISKKDVRNKSSSNKIELDKEQQKPLTKDENLGVQTELYPSVNTEKATDVSRGQQVMLIDDPLNHSISMSEIDEDINAILTEIEEDNALSALNVNASNVCTRSESSYDQDLTGKLENIKKNLKKDEVKGSDGNSAKLTNASRKIEFRNLIAKPCTYKSNNDTDICVIIDPPQEIIYVSDDLDKSLIERVSNKTVKKIEKIANNTKKRYATSMENIVLKTNFAEQKSDEIKKFNQSNIIKENFCQKYELKRERIFLPTENCISLKTQTFSKATITPSVLKRNNVFSKTPNKVKGVKRPVIKLEPNPDQSSPSPVIAKKVSKKLNNISNISIKGLYEQFSKNEKNCLIVGAQDELSLHNAQEIVKSHCGIIGKRSNDLNSEQMPFLKKAKIVAPIDQDLSLSQNIHTKNEMQNPFKFNSNKYIESQFAINPTSSSSTNKGKATMIGNNSNLNSNKSNPNPRRIRNRDKRQQKGMHSKKAIQLVLSNNESRSREVENLRQQANFQKNQTIQKTQMPNPSSNGKVTRKKKQKKNKTNIPMQLNEITNKTTKASNQRITGPIVSNDLKSRSSLNIPAASLQMQFGEHPNSNTTPELNNSEAYSHCGEPENSLKIVILHAQHPIWILTQSHIEQIKRSLLFEVDNTKNMNTNLGFFDCTSEDGVLMLTCNNAETKNWVINTVDTLKPFLQGSLIVTEESAQPKYLCLLHLSKNDVLPMFQLLLRLEKQNHNLSTKNWKILKSVPDLEEGIKLIFSIDEMSKERILAQHCTLFLNFGQINIKIIDKSGQRVGDINIQENISNDPLISSFNNWFLNKNAVFPKMHYSNQRNNVFNPIQPAIEKEFQNPWGVQYSDNEFIINNAANECINMDNSQINYPVLGFNLNPFSTITNNLQSNF